MGRIYTSYYAQAKTMDSSKYAYVRISTSIPKWWTKPIFSLPELFPGWELVDPIKGGEISWEEYVGKYDKKLSGLSKEEILKKLEAIGKMTGTEKDILLLCYETPEKPCHRHLVAEWLGNVKEFGMDLEQENELELPEGVRE